jgi:NitT/TauT family transport system substrate-binding protein
MKRISSLCGVILAAALVGFGVSRQSRGDGPVANPTPVKLVLNWNPEPEFGGFYAAREQGIFAKHGLDVKITAGPNPTIQMLAKGDADFAILSADEIVQARVNPLEAIDVVGVFATYQTCPQGIMTHASRGFKSLADVFSHPGVVEMEPGLGYKDYLKNLYGFDKVQVAAYDYTVTRFMAQTDVSQQCFVTSEPITAKNQGGDPQTFLMADVGYNPYTTVLAVRGDTLRNKPELVKSMVAAVREGWRAYLDDPKATNEAMAKINKDMDLPTFTEVAEIQKKFIETEETGKIGLGNMTAKRWDDLADILLKLKDREGQPLIQSKPKAEECFANID